MSTDRFGSKFTVSVSDVTITQPSAVKYSDSQPRAKDGTWTSTGASAGGYVAGTDMTDEVIKQMKDPNSPLMQHRAANKSGGDVELEAVAHIQGFDGRPEIISQADFDSVGMFGSKVKGIAAYRGVKPYTRADGTEIQGDAIVDEFVNGDYYAGYGVYGNGIYVASGQHSISYDQAAQYAFGRFTPSAEYESKPGRVIQMVIPHTAKIASAEQAEQIVKSFDEKRSAGFGNATGLATAIAAAGYDGYEVRGATVILNRTVLKVVAND